MAVISMVSELLQVLGETFAMSEKSGIHKNLGVYFYGDLNYPCPHSGVQYKHLNRMD